MSSDPISALTPISPLTPLKPSAETKTAGKDGTEFSAFLKNAINELDNSQLEAEKAAAELLTGQTEDFHTPVIAMEKANLTLALAVNVRNKILDAYHEIMRMQI